MKVWQAILIEHSLNVEIISDTKVNIKNVGYLWNADESAPTQWIDETVERSEEGFIAISSLGNVGSFENIHEYLGY